MHHVSTLGPALIYNVIINRILSVSNPCFNVPDPVLWLVDAPFSREQTVAVFGITNAYQPNSKQAPSLKGVGFPP